MKIRMPDTLTVYGEKQQLIGTSNAAEVLFEDVHTELTLSDGCMRLFLRAVATPVCYLKLSWTLTADEQFSDRFSILGDAWERGYGDLEWKKPDPDRCMPWYCMAANGSDAASELTGRKAFGFGVRVRPSAFCMWQLDGKTLTMTADVRNGNSGVLLYGRRLQVCEIVFAEYTDISAFDAACRFCKRLCDDLILPSSPVFGFNNWYYAYGESSEEEILADARRLAELSENCAASPYMVIDDGWQAVFNDGPWHRGNEKFPDMQGLARRISEIGVQPGIWVRPLSLSAHPEVKTPDAWRLRDSDRYLDPSHPSVLGYVEQIMARVVEWGYRLIKFDFVTFDIFEQWGMEAAGFMGEGETRWHFYDRSRTTAEIITDMYRAIRKGAGDAVLIGCNAIGHLCAGLVEVNRTGDDTSGREWERTRKMGVNTLAFRMPQNKVFFLADADCVGITPDIEWHRNEQWLRVLAKSGTALFISWDRRCDTPEIREAVRCALEENSHQNDACRPIDWMEHLVPQRWQVNEREQGFDWT